MARLLAALLATTFALWAVEIRAQEEEEEEEVDEPEVSPEPEIAPDPGIEPPRETIGDIASVVIHGGGYWPAADVGGGTFQSSGTVGANITFWLDGIVGGGTRGVTDLIGARASFLFAQTDVTGLVPAELSGADPDVWHINGDLVLRGPVRMPVGWLMPYALGGLGTKIYNFENGSEADFTGNFGAGLEFRLGAGGRIGIGTEFRSFLSGFDRFGVDDTQWDLVWTGFLSGSL